MTWTGRGRIQRGTLVLEVPPGLPEGADVLVQLETMPAHGMEAEPAFEDLPFFGMHADLVGTTDSAEQVRRAREQWQHRANRAD
jgi:hypothetical protein